MGLFKKLKKVAKSISKGIGKIPVIGAVHRAGKHVFKQTIGKAWKTKLGKILIIAAAIYFTGGLAAGSFAPSAVAGQYAAWGSQAATALGGTGAASGTAGTLGSTAATTAGTAGTVSSGLGLSAEALAAGSGGIGTIATGAGTAATAAGAAGVSTAAAGAGIGSASGGLLGAAKAAGTALNTWATANPLLATGAVTAGAKAIEAMNTPSAEEETAGALRAQQQANALPSDFASRLNPLYQPTGGLLNQAQARTQPAPTATAPQVGAVNPAAYGMSQRQYDEQIARINQFAPLGG